MAYAAGRGVGIRLDCLGDLRNLPDGAPGWSHMRSLYPQEIVRSGVQNVWQKRPIALESCWTPTYWKQHGWDETAILAQALRWHVSALNIKSTPIPAEQRRARRAPRDRGSHARRLVRARLDQLEMTDAARIRSATGTAASRSSAHASARRACPSTATASIPRRARTPWIRYASPSPLW